MPKIKDSCLLQNDRIRNCGFSGVEERLTSTDMQRLVVPQLSSPLYVERQKATRELMSGETDLRVLYEALSNSDHNLRRRAVDILDVVEFNKERKTFHRVGDQESWKILIEEKQKLRDFRKQELKEFPKGKIPSNITKATCKSKIYDSIDIDELKQKIYAFETLENKNNLLQEVVKGTIKETLMNMVDEISNTPESLDNKVGILKTLMKIEWNDYNRNAGFRLLSAIEDTSFKGSIYSHPRIKELLNLGIDARALLGLDSINLLISADRQLFPSNVILDKYLENYKQSYRDYLGLLSDSKDGALLNKQGELLFYYREFLGAATCCQGPFFNASDSPVFFNFVKDFNLALKEKDLLKIRTLYNNNIDILKLIEFDQEELCCDWNVLRYRNYLPQVVDKILRVEEKKGELSPSLDALYQICLLEDVPATGMKNLDLEIERVLKKCDELLLDGAKDSKKDFSELLQNLAKWREGIWNLASLVSKMQEDTMPEKLKEAYWGYLETDEDSLEQNLIKMLQSGSKELDIKLKKFYRPDYVSPVVTQQVYEALVVIENNTHFDYPDKVVRHAEMYKRNIISKLRTSEQDAFICINEATDFVLKVDRY